MARIKNFLTPQWLKEFEEMKKQASKNKRASNQQASKGSSTVAHDPRATDEQAKPSLKSS
jgi:hypothetical protein|tara:strand:- start:779 stop:958 length:180 start_codon:yes stop_codon:yes gene_type:complete